MQKRTGLATILVNADLKRKYRMAYSLGFARIFPSCLRKKVDSISLDISLGWRALRSVVALKSPHWAGVKIHHSRWSVHIRSTLGSGSTLLWCSSWLRGAYFVPQIIPLAVYEHSVGCLKLCLYNPYSNSLFSLGVMLILRGWTSLFVFRFVLPMDLQSIRLFSGRMFPFLPRRKWISPSRLCQEI